jgi:hypothetical protein
VIKLDEVFSLFVTFLITLCGILIVLFSGEGVTVFADISEVQYAVAFLTAFTAAGKDLQSQRKPT